MKTLEQAVRVSALSHLLKSMGGAMVEHHGWLTAARFTSSDDEARCIRDTVGLSDVSRMAKFDVKGNAPLPSLLTDTNGELKIWTIAQKHWLITSESKTNEIALKTLQDAFSQDRCLHMTDVTSVYAAILLAGPKSTDVLNKLCALDLSDVALANQSCAQTGLSHVHGIVLRDDLREVRAYRLLIPRDVAEFVWETVMHAGEEFGIMPFGKEALDVISSSS